MELDTKKWTQRLKLDRETALFKVVVESGVDPERAMRIVAGMMARTSSTPVPESAAAAPSGETATAIFSVRAEPMADETLVIRRIKETVTVLTTPTLVLELIRTHLREKGGKDSAMQYNEPDGRPSEEAWTYTDRWVDLSTGASRGSTQGQIKELLDNANMNSTPKHIRAHLTKTVRRLFITNSRVGVNLFHVDNCVDGKAGDLKPGGLSWTVSMHVGSPNWVGKVQLAIRDHGSLDIPAGHSYAFPGYILEHKTQVLNHIDGPGERYTVVGFYVVKTGHASRFKTDIRKLYGITV